MIQLNRFVVGTGDQDPCEHEIVLNEPRCETECSLKRFDGLRGRLCAGCDMERGC